MKAGRAGTHRCRASLLLGWRGGVPLPAAEAHLPGYAVGVTRDLLFDGHGRQISDLRVSVTDRCNFRCQYCMPADGLPWLERDAILTFEEIERIVRVFASMGVDELRLTGGEPPVRRDFPRLPGVLPPGPGVRGGSLPPNG